MSVLRKKVENEGNIPELIIFFILFTYCFLIYRDGMEKLSL